MPSDKPPRIGTGVTGELVRLLRAATRKKPLTAAAALTRLKKKFPDHPAEDLELFLSTNLPTRLRSVRKLDVRNNGHSPRGFWIHKADVQLPDSPYLEDEL